MSNFYESQKNSDEGFNFLTALFRIHNVFICIAISHIIYRIILVLQELHCYRSNYGHRLNFYDLLRSGFTFKTAPTIILISTPVSFFAFLAFYPNAYRQYIDENISFCRLALVSAPILIMLISRFDRCSIMHKYFIRDPEFMDYGSGMALSFFYGYLNILLTTQDQGLDQRIQNYMTNHNVNFPIRKFFIVIPTNRLHLPALLDFDCHDDGRFWNRRSLEDVKINRAGVRGRSYTTAVYSIRIGPDSAHYREDANEWYVCLEGATPILTFLESWRGGQAEVMADMKNEIILKFTHKLREVLERENCDRQIELVLFDSDSQVLEDVIEQRITELIALRNRKKN